jgi:hypothetical protein
MLLRKFALRVIGMKRVRGCAYTCINSLYFSLEHGGFQRIFMDPVSSRVLLRSVFNRPKKKDMHHVLEKNEGKNQVQHASSQSILSQSNYY